MWAEALGLTSAFPTRASSDLGAGAGISAAKDAEPMPASTLVIASTAIAAATHFDFICDISDIAQPSCLPNWRIRSPNRFRLPLYRMQKRICLGQVGTADGSIR